jgi:prepilin-type N-terminal cleavage/methylation domain-containing protein
LIENMLFKPHKYMSGRGLTLVELLVALAITGIILTSVAAIANAVTVATESSKDIVTKEAYLRYTFLRLSEMIKQSKLICGNPGSDLVLWRADDDGDKLIDPSELVFIEAGQARSYLKILEFKTAPAGTVTLSSIRSGAAKTSLLANNIPTEIAIIPSCSNVQFLGLSATVAMSKSVAISFNQSEGRDQRKCQINASLRCWSGNLLNSSGDTLVSDDD